MQLAQELIPPGGPKIPDELGAGFTLETVLRLGDLTESMFKRLSEAMNDPAMGDDPKYQGNANRVEHQEEIDAKVAAWTKTLSSSEALGILDDAGVAAGPIFSVADMFEDPQYKARGLLQEVTINGEPLHIPAILPRLAETPGETEWPGPAVGSHNAEIFGEILGLSEEETNSLSEAGVI